MTTTCFHTRNLRFPYENILLKFPKIVDFRVLKNLFKEKVKHLVLIGETKNKLREVLNGSFSYEDAESMEDAVERSMEKATAGDIVLLSPGCSSFDMFEDFIERGNQFKEIVGRL